MSFRGSSQIMTPNIDALAFSGIILDRYYVTPICTPSRSALMTGKYPIHTGMQHTVLYAAEPRGLPLSEKLLPQYLKELGYNNHIVGKWHLGHYKKEYTPMQRGFDSHVGFWTGHHDYFDHTAQEKPSWGLDIRRGMELAQDLHGVYTTDIISQEAVKVIQSHNTSNPLFLYVAHAAVHSGNPYNPLPAPDDVVAKITHIDNYNRRKFAAMVTKLDESVGLVVKALQARNMLKNSIIVFSTDNGGPADGFNLNAASNWPLRGVKNTLWEGGVRGAGLIWSPLIKERQRVGKQLIHISDWLPTLLTAAGGNVSELIESIDGKNIWNQLVSDEPSPRTEILHNIDDIYGSSAVMSGEWKLVYGTNYNGTWDSWYGPAGNRSFNAYNIESVFNSFAGKALKQINALPSPQKIEKLRHDADIICGDSEHQKNHCNPLIEPCLFNIMNDSCEQNNLAQKYPHIANTMLNVLSKYNQSAIPPGNLPLDPRGDPRYWDYVWLNFGDYSNTGNYMKADSVIHKL